MPLIITPEIGIPLPIDVTPEEVEQFRERAKAACATLQELMDAGAEIEITPDDSRQARELMAADKPFKVSKTTPGTILKLESLLTEYDHEFLGANRRIANYVTNRLLEETVDEDARVRLKALELLGKRRGVNLFSEQMEITIRQKPTEDLEGELATLLEKYMGDAEVVENEPPPIIDLDAELGPEPPIDDTADTSDTEDESNITSESA
jgi:hypothetical protein